jgi:hypothetical protein
MFFFTKIINTSNSSIKWQKQTRGHPLLSMSLKKKIERVWRQKKLFKEKVGQENKRVK